MKASPLDAYFIPWRQFGSGLQTEKFGVLEKTRVGDDPVVIQYLLKKTGLKGLYKDQAVFE
jgi:hypothetical protein